MAEIKIGIWRYLSDSPSSEPFLQYYSINYNNDTSLLDALKDIRANDPSLSFRYSCGLGICGSCGAILNYNNSRKPVLLCQTFIRDYLEHGIILEPLDNFPVEKDLVVNMVPFMEKWESVDPYLIPDEKAILEDGYHLQSPEQLSKYIQFADCIKCGLCQAACPHVGLNPNFLGPAAIVSAHRYNEDSRDTGRAKRIEKISTDDGVWNCSAVGYCSEVCPHSVDPAHAVNQNKVNSALDYFLRFFR